MLTLLFVHTEHHNNLVATNSDELLDTSDTSSRQLREQNHAVDVVILQELNIGTHLGDLRSVRERLPDKSGCY
jgi:hypothetical protein